MNLDAKARLLAKKALISRSKDLDPIYPWSFNNVSDASGQERFARSFPVRAGWRNW